MDVALIWPTCCLIKTIINMEVDQQKDENFTRQINGINCLSKKSQKILEPFKQTINVPVCHIVNNQLIIKCPVKEKRELHQCVCVSEQGHVSLMQ